MKLTIEITEAQQTKLTKFAEWQTKNMRRNMTVNDVILSWIDGCLVGGGAWVPPDQAAQRYEAEKAAQDTE